MSKRANPTSLDGRLPTSRRARKRMRGRAKDLLREGRGLLRRGRASLDVAVADRIGAALDALSVALKEPEGDAALSAVVRQAEALDQLLESHLGGRRKSALREYVESIGWAVVLALVIRCFIFEAFSIPSGSMIPTLEIGDHLFVNKIGYGLYVPFSSSRLVHWDEPEPGDIIVFEFQRAGSRHDGEDYIKRVVAGPGQKVRLKANTLLVDDQPTVVEALGDASCALYGGDDAETPYGHCPCVRQREDVGGHQFITQHMNPAALAGGARFECANRPDWPLEVASPLAGPGFGAQHPSREFKPNPDWPDFVVPEGHVMVMGDNRDMSEDSRYWGLVPYDRIKGTAFVIWWARDLDRIFNWLG